MHRNSGPFKPVQRHDAEAALQGMRVTRAEDVDLQGHYLLSMSYSVK
jgi:hypothetical protein